MSGGLGSTSGRVTVIGGGLAGIAVALDCAQAGAQVTLVEVRPRLGGAAYSFERDGLWLDNGQHVFLRCCTAYQGLLDRLGMTANAPLQPRFDVPVLTPSRRTRLRRNRMPAPLHLLPTLLRYPLVSLAGRARVGQAALAMRGVDLTDPATDEVCAEVEAFSRHATWWSKLGSPVTSVIQQVVTDRYLRAL